MRVDGVTALTLWVWVLRELVKHEGELELTTIMRETFKREKHHAATHVVNALVRRGYATAHKDGNMIRIRVTELGRAAVFGIDDKLLEYRAEPPEKNRQWLKTKRAKAGTSRKKAKTKRSVRSRSRPPAS